ncbi:AIPR family protein [Amycolatopsis solani]|uniref:AIPR family protein n=1 Tax=Amycolatopsis solani TaxID=3028615 RepID=UPI0025B07FF5|nr:AIPR family protein [Amycolatopsis sp. MEP2-6]
MRSGQTGDEAAVDVSGGSRRGREMPLEVQHIRDALRREFTSRISMADYEGRAGTDFDNAFLSRALAARAARILTDCSSDEAAAGVIDGRDDFGIDAVAFSASGSELWLIQAKWSDRGQAGFNTAAAHKLIHGLKKLDNRDFDQFNVRLQSLADRVRGVLGLPTCKVFLIVAVVGEGRLSEETEAILKEAAIDFGGWGRTVEHRVLNQAAFHRAVREDLAPEPITIVATMSEGWHSRETPYQAFDGLVCVEELANWYADHGERLYDRNVRRSLGLTGVNQTLVESLTDDPQGFWYRHNGITVQCNTIEQEFFAQRGPSKPVRLTLHNASVVNGAQTVTSAYRAYERTPDALGEAFVTVRIISVNGTPEGFAKEITKATNTQNHMERRDFIAIDETQSLIREDFRLTLDKEYVFKRGEIDPAPASGCSVREAATALACAYPDPILAVRVNGSTEALWEEGPGGAYTRLFGKQPNACQIWRTVLLMRAVRDALHDVRSTLSGRSASIAESGALLIAHIVFQLVGTDGIEEIDSEWESGLNEVPALVEGVLAQLIPLMDHFFGEGSYVTSTFANEQRCQQLVTGVLQALAEGTNVRDLTTFQSDIPKPRRRPSTVSLIIDHNLIPAGTRLEYQPSPTEEQAIGIWLRNGQGRSFATWVDDRRRPLLWEADGQRYSPSGLVTQIWRKADWREAWSAVQGPKQWYVPGEGSLVEIAERLWQRIITEEWSRERETTKDADS